MADCPPGSPRSSRRTTKSPLYCGPSGELAQRPRRRAEVLQALLIAAVSGIPLGLLAGFLGGPVAAGLGGVPAALLSLPPLIMARAVVEIIGPGLGNVMLVIGPVPPPPLFRLARGAAQSVTSETNI